MGQFRGAVQREILEAPVGLAGILGRDPRADQLGGDMGAARRVPCAIVPLHIEIRGLEIRGMPSQFVLPRIIPETNGLAIKRDITLDSVCLDHAIESAQFPDEASSHRLPRIDDFEACRLERRHIAGGNGEAADAGNGGDITVCRTDGLTRSNRPRHQVRIGL